ncbi:MAG: HIT family protein [Candidatus Xenobia bacterium]
MERLWAPWRIGYILNGDKPTGCIFCDYPNRQDDAASLILERGKNVFAILNRYPYNNGHLMVVPYRHTAVLDELGDTENLELMAMVRRWTARLQERMGAHGFNLGMNLGRVAGAGIADHLHMHIVPRWNGDVNFMSTVAETRVISQSLEEAWRQLRVKPETP